MLYGKDRSFVSESLLFLSVTVSSTAVVVVSGM